jgi:two-component system sensor kinase FixL
MEGIDAVPREVVVRTVVREADEIEVSVCDNGCGLSDQQEDRLFKPFFTTKPHGVGVGLSISRSIITAHHGKMWFSPNSDRGTTFFFTLPIISEVGHGAA